MKSFHQFFVHEYNAPVGLDEDLIQRSYLYERLTLHYVADERMFMIDVKDAHS
jgi:hypothetical protein